MTIPPPPPPGNPANREQPVKPPSSSRPPVAAPPSTPPPQPMVAPLPTVVSTTCPHCRSVLQIDSSQVVGTVCPMCQQHFSPQRTAARPVRPLGILAPLVISCVSNVLLAILWGLTGVGLIFSPFLIALAGCEFATTTSSNVRYLVRNSKMVAIGEIASGLCLNVVSLICGIVILINAANEERKLA